MKYTYLFFTLAFLLAPISTTYAQLVAIPTRTTVEALDQHRAIQVYNNGDKQLY